MKNIITGTYYILNLVNGKIYNGSSIDVRARLNLHVRRLKNNKHTNRYLQSAINKYGLENFRFEKRTEIAIVWDLKSWTKEQKEIIKQCLLAEEQIWLDSDESYNREKGYNLCPIAGSSLGRKCSEERIKQLREIANRPEAIEKQRSNKIEWYKNPKNHIKTAITTKAAMDQPRVRAKLSEFQNRPEILEANRKRNSGKGNPMSGKNAENFMTPEAIEERRRKLKEIANTPKTKEKFIKILAGANRGKHPSLETRAKLSILASKRTGENNPGAKLTLVLVVEIREKYASGKYLQRELAKEYGVSLSTIGRIITNKRWFF